MGLIVKDVYACTLPSGVRQPDGCYLNADCSCSFADGTTMSIKAWSDANLKVESRANSTYFIIGLVIIIGAAIALRYFRRKLRSYS